MCFVKCVQMSYEEVMVVVDQIEVDDPKDGDYMPPSAQSKPKSTIDLEEKKQLIAAEVKRFPCLWDKKSKYHRIQTKREAAWSQIASEMDMTGKYIESVEVPVTSIFFTAESLCFFFARQ